MLYVYRYFKTKTPRQHGFLNLLFATAARGGFQSSMCSLLSGMSEIACRYGNNRGGFFSLDFLFHDSLIYKKGKKIWLLVEKKFSNFKISLSLCAINKTTSTCNNFFNFKKLTKLCIFIMVNLSIFDI